MHIGKRLRRFDEAAQPLEDCRHARLVVSRQDGIAHAADHAAFHHGLDAAARTHGVHMPAKRHGTGRVAGSERDQIARIGAGLNRGIIDSHGEPEVLQLGFATFRHRGLIARWAFNAGKFAEQFEQAVGLHRAPLSIGMSVRRYTRKAARERLSDELHINRYRIAPATAQGMLETTMQMRTTAPVSERHALAP